MKERGINSTFKKIIYESSEMVFLADDTYPYNIFYSNQAFESLIGQFLEEKSLVGLGLDINSYIFNEEMILNFMGVEYTFFLELPQENASNYFLFYKGKEMRGQGLPTKKDSQYFFRNTVDLIGIGQETYLTWVSNSIKPMLGYSPEEIVNIELCSYFHPDDIEHVRALTFDIRQERKNSQFVARLLSKGGEYRWFEFHVHFIVGKFYAMARDVTALKTELLEKENLNEFYALCEGVTNLGFFEISTQANTVALTDSLKQLLEVKTEGVLTLEETIQIFQDSDRQLLKDSLSEMMVTGKGIELTLEVPVEGARSKWVKLIGQTKQENNRETRVFGTVQDITATFEEHNQLDVYRELFYLSPDPMVITDLSGKIIYSNQAARTKFAPDDQIGFPDKISGFEPILAEKEIWDSHVEQLTSSGSKVYQSAVINSAGKEMLSEVNAKFIQIQGRTLVVSIFRDISDREAPVKTSAGPSDFLHHLTEHIPGALYQFVLDKEGEMKFSYLSPGIKNLLDLGETEFAEFNDVGKAISKVHPEDIAKVLTSTVSSARKLSPWTCKFRIQEPGTSDFKWVQGAAKPELLENGDVVWYGYLTDITDQKMFEDRLHDAREEAMKASQVKSEFLSIISHELRTPLNAISGSLYSLLQDEHTPVQKSAFNTINFAVENLITMINDLLDFQKIEAGKLTLEKSPMNLETVVKRVIEGLQFHAKDSGNQLQLKFKNNLDLEVKGDKVRIAQVLNNLISNALKFTKNGNVDVIIELKSQTDSKVRVYFEVSDNGIGIAKEHKDRIFNEFDQIQHSFSKKYGGTGLGLSITKKLLDLMNSKIDLHSEPNVGSSFFFEIDFEKVYVQHSEIDNISSSEISIASNGELNVPESSQGGWGEGKPTKKGPSALSEVRLLMVEDNDVNALVLGKIIKKWGIQYERVNNGKLAVEAMEQGEFNCVLMDIQMPVMNGFEATEKIREFSTVPILALSAADKVEVMDKIEQTGFAGYVAKPIDAAELLKKIKEVLNIVNQSA
ncbi:PAS domain-containing hybrid sensor histidine kinase/response regulator [Mongoliibacter ruber]|uniref:histidine kinase n=1 Tax=Mongoliibacter ruber TaxID=1750599 RepID=A0A2T0WP67_9BACT|nr:ATP-binding protein [Mongoliibacter ruber]PRY88489.1 PAS domain S-box-containing protein [Mongoliibacter ruber]